MMPAIVRFRQVLLCGLVASLAVPATTGCRRSPETRAGGRLFGVSLQSMDNPVFVEDLVRAVSVKCDAHPDIQWYRVEAENFESIHNHSAYAMIERG